jgi:hypothetical protein
MFKPCPCGSEKPRFELRDALGIFCTFICDDCEDEKRARFRPEIFSDPNWWQDTGEVIEGD